MNDTMIQVSNEDQQRYIKINTITCYKLMATCFGRPCGHHQASFTDRVPSMRVQYGMEGTRSVKLA